jgi:hypothetical protein
MQRDELGASSAMADRTVRYRFKPSACAVSVWRLKKFEKAEGLLASFV